MKHFLANENEDGRTHTSSDFDERLFREYYSVPFRMGFEEGGSRAVMAAYNSWNGTPMMIHPVLKDVMIKEWGNDGLICTDGGALGLLITSHKSISRQGAGIGGGGEGGDQSFSRYLQARSDQGTEGWPADRSGHGCRAEESADACICSWARWTRREWIPTRRLGSRRTESFRRGSASRARHWRGRQRTSRLCC